MYTPNSSSYVDYSINSYQAILRLSAVNLKTGANINNANYTLDNSGYITYGSNNSNNYTFFYVNASSYDITANATGYFDQNATVNVIKKQQTNYEFNMPFIANFSLYDEKTNEGNYWDDYKGVDLFPRDGIGDKPYSILGDGEDSGEYDPYPLMEKVGKSRSKSVDYPVFNQLLQKLLNMVLLNSQLI